MNERLPQSADMPDAYDRQLASLHDLPDVTRTKAATVRVVPPLGVGGTLVFIVQTYRQATRGDTVFLEVVGNTGAMRIAIPPKVAATIARQRDALTTKSRSKAATAVAADRKAQGLQPAFLKAR